MPRAKKVPINQDDYRLKPSTNPEAEESQMIALAVNLAKKQLIDGSASAQVITHFLKLANSKTELERENLELQNRLLEAKTDAIQRSQTNEEVYQKALEAMRRYTGSDSIG